MFEVSSNSEILVIVKIIIKNSVGKDFLYHITKNVQKGNFTDECKSSAKGGLI